jgi:hypothetical protein
MIFLLNIKPKSFSHEVKNLIEEKRREGLDAACGKLCVEVNCFYEDCTEYLKKWILQVWMALNYIPQYSSVELPLKFLIKVFISTDDVKCFDQLSI